MATLVTPHAVLLEQYSAVLKEMGYSPEVKESKVAPTTPYISVKRDGVIYFLYPRESARLYLRISLPNFWDLNDAKNRENALIKMIQAGADVRVCKLVIVADHEVWASYETYIADMSEAKDEIQRAFAHLGAIVGRFLQMIAE